MAVRPHLAVTCVTCGTRLRVLDTSLIGGIANCPKCGSMVEISADRLETRGGTASRTNSAAAPPVDASHRDMPAAADQTRRPQISVGPESGVDSEALTQSTVASPQEIEAADAGEVPSDGRDGSPPSELPIDPAEVWQSESSRRTSQMAMVALLGLFGLLAATIAFVQFARSWYRPPAVAVQVETTEESAASPAQSEPAKVTEPDPFDEPAEEADSTDGGEENGEPDRAEENSNAEAEQPGEAPAGTAAAETPTGTASDTPTDTGEPAEIPGSAQAIASLTPPAIFGPEEIAGGGPSDAIPDRADDDAAAEGTNLSSSKTVPEEPADGMAELPAGLRRFVPLMDLSTEGNGPPQVFDTPPTLESLRLDAAAEEEPEPDAIQRPPLNLPRALSMRFAIDHSGMTPAELTLLIGQLTGAPIEIELISLDAAAIPLDRPLTLPSGWLTAAQWLEQTLEPAGMGFEVIDGRVLVYALPEMLRESLTPVLRLDDFAARAAEVAEWIRPVVGPISPVENDRPAEAEEVEPVVPDELETGGLLQFVAEEKRIEAPSDRAALVRTAMAVEAARMIHGLPGRLDRRFTARWIGKWDKAAGENADAGGRSVSISDWPPVSGGRWGLTLYTPRTSAGLLRRLGSDNRTVINVAWHDAMRNQFYPADSAMPFTEGLDAGGFLEELLGDFGLEGRDAGDGVWWIGSEATYDRYEVICWVPIPRGSGEQTAARLAAALGAGDAAMLPVTWNDELLMVRAPRYLARQLHRLLQSP